MSLNSPPSVIFGVVFQNDQTDCHQQDAEDAERSHVFREDKGADHGGDDGFGDAQYRCFAGSGLGQAVGVEHVRKDRFEYRDTQ